MSTAEQALRNAEQYLLKRYGKRELRSVVLLRSLRAVVRLTQ